MIRSLLDTLQRESRQGGRGRVVSRQAIWALLGQVLAAAGTLIGLRIITDIASPEVYGEVTLWLGIAALGLGLIATPFLQAGLRYYPEYAERNAIGPLRRLMIAGMQPSALIVGVIALGLAVFHNSSGNDVYTVIVILAILCIDITRAMETTLLNAAQRQRTYALWAAGEAWIRPLFALAAMILIEPTPAMLLAGYFIGSATCLLLFYVFGTPVSGMGSPLTTTQPPNDTQRMRKYALPLIPLAVIGWISGVGDRYVIGATLGVAEVGIYAAAYALVSRPFLMLGHVIELTLRPRYMAAVAQRNFSKARKIFHAWLVLTTLVIGTTLILVFLFSDWLATLFLGKSFREGAALMPWIALGYSLLVISYVFEKVLYAYERTRCVLYVQCLGAFATVAVTFFAVTQWGLYGAAVAVPIYFGIQLVGSILFAINVERKPIAVGY